MATKKAPSKNAKAVKAAAKKAAPQKPLKKAAPQKAVKKAAPKKAASQKPVKKAAPKKVAGKKVVARKAAPAKPAKKAAPQKAVKKAAPQKPAKKPAPKKAAPRKMAKPAPKTPTPITKKARPSAEQPVKPTEIKGEGKLAGQLTAAQRTAHKFIVEIDRPTGMYNGILLSEAPKQFPKRTPYSSKEIEKLREALLDERGRLLHELESLQGVSRIALDETTDRPGYSMHLAEHATDLQTAEASLGLRTIEQERLELVDEALDRIQRNINHYGLCLACGNKIGIQRLIARPHAHLCMDCRQRYEKIRARKGL